MFKIFIESQFPQDFAHLVISNLFVIVNPLFFNPVFNGLDNLVGNLRRLFRLELRQNLFEMIKPDIGRIRHLIRRLFIRRFRRIHNIRNELATCRMITNQDTLFILWNHFTYMTIFTYIRRYYIILNINIIVCDISPVGLIRFSRLIILLRIRIRFFGVHRFNFKKRMENIGASAPRRYILFLFEIFENIFRIV